MSGPDLPALIERINLRPIRDDFAYVTIRLPDVNLSGIEARRDARGNVTLTPPMRQDRHGRPWPIFALQPAALADATRAVRLIWDGAEGAD